jgi:hypothetical protein
MVTNIVSNDEVLDLAVLGELHKDLFVKILKVVDCTDELTFGYIHTVRLCDSGIRVLIKVLEDHRLG